MKALIANREAIDGNEDDDLFNFYCNPMAASNVPILAASQPMPNHTMVSLQAKIKSLNAAKQKGIEKVDTKIKNNRNMLEILRSSRAEDLNSSPGNTQE